MTKTLLPLLSLLLALPAAATELSSSQFDISFHISHPAKEYDSALLAGGATAKLTLDPADFSQSKVACTIEVGRFDSANTRRDSHMLEVLEALIFPTITWNVNSIGLAGPLTPGTHETMASGPLTIRETTADLKVPTTITVTEAGAISVASTFTLSLDSFGVERPTLLFVKIDDEVPITVKVSFPADASVFAQPEPEPEPEPEAAAPEGAPTDDAPPAEPQ
jgi:polyisoprenoid-binding protein YceI